MSASRPLAPPTETTLALTLPLCALLFSVLATLLELGGRFTGAWHGETWLLAPWVGALCGAAFAARWSPRLLTDARRYSLAARFWAASSGAAAFILLACTSAAWSLDSAP